jgi:cytochrome c-type biogenesis protein CcmH/NrfG
MAVCKDSSKGEDSIAACTRILRREPGNAHVYDMRGNRYYAKDDYDSAIADYTQAIRLDTQSADAYGHRGNAYNEKEQWDLALSDFNRALSLDPKFSNSYGGRGKTWTNKGDLDRAIRDFDEAIRLDPEYAWAYRNRAYAYEKRGDLDSALAGYEKSLTIEPGSAFARAGRDRVTAAIASRSTQPPPATTSQPQIVSRLATAPVATPPVAATQPPTASRQAAAPAAALSWLTPQAPAMNRERRVALVIGNSRYRSVPMLSSPQRDAATISDALREAGFQVLLQTDLDRDGLRRAVSAFRTAADGADWGLIYYAGHGIQIGKANYLIPVDAQLHDEHDVETGALSYDDLEKSVAGAKALRIIILDACRAEPFTKQMSLSPGRTAGRGLSAPPASQPGLLVVYATRDGQVCDDSDGSSSTSPFARALALRLRTPDREVRRLFDDVRDDVMSSTSRRQQPSIYGSAGDRDFFFLAGR